MNEIRIDLNLPFNLPPGHYIKDIKVEIGEVSYSYYTPAPEPKINKTEVLNKLLGKFKEDQRKILDQSKRKINHG